MSTAAVQLHGTAELWRAYRQSFQEFARKVEELESKKRIGSLDRGSVHKALLELEKARVHYRHSRDVLALVLLSCQHSRFAEIQWSEDPRDDDQHVREVAQLLWEFEARREGFADDDWYRAEEIIRSARAGSPEPASVVSVPPNAVYCQEAEVR